MFLEGNSDILTKYKVGFFCSQIYPAVNILKIYDWAIARRDEGICVISGFHTPLEKDVLGYLLNGCQPIIICPARGLYRRVPTSHREAFDADRILYATAFSKEETRVSKKRAFERNAFVSNLADEIVIGYVHPGGRLDQLLQGLSNKKKVTYL